MGCEVKAEFERVQAVPTGAFVASGRRSEAGQHYYCDLVSLAKARLAAQGVSNIHGGQHCTFSDVQFFSYRRNPTTGRILSAIWIAS